MKKIIVSLIVFLSSFSYALSLDEILEPKPLMGRFSNGANVEKNVEKTASTNFEKIQKETVKTTYQIQKNDSNTVPITFADLSLQRLAKETIKEINEDENEINSDLSILWNAALERSETMKYTIYKLSNPDEDKPDDSAVKKILRPIANISSLAGASVAGDPYMAMGALIGGGLVNAFIKDDKEYNYKFSKISDTDMVLLIRKIDDLQKKLLELYIDYKTKEQVLKMAQENFKKREEIYKNSQKLLKGELTVADVCYRNAKKQTRTANDKFLTSKAILENLVGKEALLKISE